MKRFSIVVSITWLLIIIVGGFNNDELFSEDNRRNLILKHFVPERKYQAFPSATILKNILPGEWTAPPHSRITFYQDGSLMLVYHEFSEIVKKGQWNIKDNESVIIRFNENSSWKVHKFKIILLSDVNDPDIKNRYTFGILFKESERWGSSLELDFN
jgi:hypothetical protein